MVQVTGATRHRNRHVVVETYNNITFVIKLLATEKAFEETLGCGLGDNGKITNTDLFQKRTAVLTRGISLQNYICQAQKN